MIATYCLADCNLVPRDADPLWLDVSNPTPEEIAFLQEKYGVHPEFTKAPLDINETPRLERDDGVTFLLTRASQGEEPRKQLPFATCPLGIIITSSALITVCNKEKLVGSLLLRKLRAGVEYTPARLALALLMRMSATYIEHLRQMDDATIRLEKALSSSMENSEIRRMLHLEKSLVYMLTAIKGNHAVLKKVNDTNPLGLSPAEIDVLDDVLIENRQAYEMAEVFTEILGNLGDAFGAMVSNNLNKAMKLLTALTVILMVPTIVAGVYGMNVPLPFQAEAHAFYWLCAGCALACGAMWLWFRKKDWT